MLPYFLVASLFLLVVALLGTLLIFEVIGVGVYVVSGHILLPSRGDILYLYVFKYIFQVNIGSTYNSRYIFRYEIIVTE